MGSVSRYWQLRNAAMESIWILIIQQHIQDGHPYICVLALRPTALQSQARGKIQRGGFELQPRSRKQKLHLLGLCRADRHIQGGSHTAPTDMCKQQMQRMQTPHGAGWHVQALLGKQQPGTRATLRGVRREHCAHAGQCML